MTIEERAEELKKDENVVKTYETSLKSIADLFAKCIKNRDFSKDICSSFIDTIGTGVQVFIPYVNSEIVRYNTELEQLRKSIEHFELVNGIEALTDEFRFKQILMNLYNWGCFGNHQYFNKNTYVMRSRKILCKAFIDNDMDYKEVCINKCVLPDTSKNDYKMIFGEVNDFYNTLLESYDVVLVLKLYKTVNS